MCVFYNVSYVIYFIVGICLYVNDGFGINLSHYCTGLVLKFLNFELKLDDGWNLYLEKYWIIISISTALHWCIACFASLPWYNLLFGLLWYRPRY